MNSQYIPIERQTIQIDVMQSFDLFFKTRDDKMVLYCSGGQLAKEEVREKFKAHIIEDIYILKKDKQNYDRYVEKTIAGIIKNPKISSHAKAKITYNSIKNVSHLLFEKPKAEIIQRYKELISHIVEYIFKDSNALQNLINMTASDYATYNHSVNVGIISTGLAKELLQEGQRHDFFEMAKGFFLHDIGKCMIPEEILHKEGSLSHQEWELIKRHPKDGIRILVKFNELNDVIKPIVLQHHEQPDGKGYPVGLKSDDIHVYAKICSIADAFDALTENRPYRKAYSTFEALKIMKNKMFKYLDPKYFAGFVKLFVNNK